MQTAVCIWKLRTKDRIISRYICMGTMHFLYKAKMLFDESMNFIENCCLLLLLTLRSIWYFGSIFFLFLEQFSHIRNIVSTSNGMFGSAIRYKLPENIFENYEKFKLLKITRVNSPNQTFGYQFKTPNQKALCIETNMF